ncbi:MAG: late competence development ComFB family protein [Spirochaetales bacterium]|jgi:competence protein ComFB|nr:late competence development ComFB family protein [Spirochaetales bacterium]
METTKQEFINQMEKLVLDTVDDFADSLEAHNSPICTCPQCRLDVTCYVLNNIPPQYIISSRGMAHLQADYQLKIQKTADVIQMTKQGFEIVSRVKRPGFVHKGEAAGEIIEEKPCFNFPLITGQLLNGQNFAPLNEKQEVSLLIDGWPAEMCNSNWPNPYILVPTLPGNFMFLPKPFFTAQPGETRTFSLTLQLKAEGYHNLSHNFTLDLVSDSRVLSALKTNKKYTVQELYAFKTDFVEENL